MTDKTKPLSAAARSVLTPAVTRDDHLVRLPRLPAAAARQVIRSMLNAGLVEEVPAPIDDAAYLWRTGEDGRVLKLRATALGLGRVAEGAGSAIGLESIRAAGDAAAESSGPIEACPNIPPIAVTPPADDAADSAVMPRQDGQRRSGNRRAATHALAVSQAHGTLQQSAGAVAPIGHRLSLRSASQGLLDAWDRVIGSDGNIMDVLLGPIDDLRIALTPRSPRSPATNTPRAPKDTKQTRVLAMLRRAEGASGPQIAEAMGWAPHTVRGFLAGLARKGMAITVLDRVRQVGPNKTGAKGSYSIYRLADEVRS